MYGSEELQTSILLECFSQSCRHGQNSSSFRSPEPFLRKLLHTSKNFVNYTEVGLQAAFKSYGKLIKSIICRRGKKYSVLYFVCNLLWCESLTAKIVSECLMAEIVIVYFQSIKVHFDRLWENLCAELIFRIWFILQDVSGQWLIYNCVNYQGNVLWSCFLICVQVREKSFKIQCLHFSRHISLQRLCEVSDDKLEFTLFVIWLICSLSR